MLEDKELQVVWNSVEYRHKRQVGMGFFLQMFPHQDKQKKKEWISKN